MQGKQQKNVRLSGTMFICKTFYEKLESLSYIENTQENSTNFLKSVLCRESHMLKEKQK